MRHTEGGHRLNLPLCAAMDAVCGSDLQVMSAISDGKLKVVSVAETELEDIAADDVGMRTDRPCTPKIWVGCGAALNYKRVASASFSCALLFSWS